MSEYSELRARALEVNRKTQNLNLCIPGRGECCTGVVPMTTEDGDLINQAFEEGKLPDVIKQAAIKNASDPNRLACPFLSKTNKCLIYNFRPLICISWGIGGKPDSAEVAFKAAVENQIFGKEPSLPAKYLVNRACQGCARLGDPDTKYQVADLVEIDAAVDFVHKTKDTTTGEFVRNYLT